MRSSRRIALAIVLASLSVRHICLAATGSVSSASIQLSSESGFLDLGSVEQSESLRQTSTPVRVTLTGTTDSVPHPVEVYACVASEVAMRLTDKPATLAIATLRIRNDHGEWMELEPLPELEGRRGVRIAVLNSTSATILLQVQLQVPAGQAPGRYQGTLTLVAKEQ